MSNVSNVKDSDKTQVKTENKDSVENENKTLIEINLVLNGCYTCNKVYKYFYSIQDNEWDGEFTDNLTRNKFICHFVDNKVVSGKQYNGDRLVYEGEFADNYHHGNGTIYDHCNNKFTGLFRKGLLVELESAKYEDTLVEKISKDLYHITYKNDNEYEGSIYSTQRPVPHGRGKMTYSQTNAYDGYDYEGMFDQERRTGIGYSTYGYNILVRKWKDDQIVEVYDTIRTG